MHTLQKFYVSAAVIALSFVIAAALHIYPRAHAAGSKVQPGTSGSPTALQPAEGHTMWHMVGISREVILENKTMTEKQIELVWDQFYQQAELHKGMDWSKPLAVYAFYHRFSTTMDKATLSIGYRRSRVKNQSTVGASEIFLMPSPSGNGITVDDASTEAIAKAWDDLKMDPVPTGVIEYYRLTTAGNIDGVSLYVHR